MLRESPCLLAVDCSCLLFLVRCLLLRGVVICLMSAVCGLLSVVRCVLLLLVVLVFVVRWYSLFDVCKCCFVVCCVLVVVVCRRWGFLVRRWWLFVG